MLPHRGPHEAIRPGDAARTPGFKGALIFYARPRRALRGPQFVHGLQRRSHCARRLARALRTTAGPPTIGSRLAAPRASSPSRTPSRARKTPPEWLAPFPLRRARSDAADLIRPENGPVARRGAVGQASLPTDDEAGGHAGSRTTTRGTSASTTLRRGAAVREAQAVVLAPMCPDEWFAWEAQREAPSIAGPVPGEHAARPPTTTTRARVHPERAPACGGAGACIGFLDGDAITNPLAHDL